MLLSVDELLLDNCWVIDCMGGGAEQNVPSVPQTKSKNCSNLKYEHYSSATKGLLLRGRQKQKKRQDGPLELDVKFGPLTFTTSV